MRAKDFMLINEHSKLRIILPILRAILPISRHDGFWQSCDCLHEAGPIKHHFHIDNYGFQLFSRHVLGKTKPQDASTEKRV